MNFEKEFTRFKFNLLSLGYNKKGFIEAFLSYEPEVEEKSEEEMMKLSLKEIYRKYQRDIDDFIIDEYSSI